VSLPLLSRATRRVEDASSVSFASLRSAAGTSPAVESRSKISLHQQVSGVGMGSAGCDSIGAIVLWAQAISQRGFAMFPAISVRVRVR
jgi:hypothetical protein